MVWIHSPEALNLLGAWAAELSPVLQKLISRGCLPVSELMFNSHALLAQCNMSLSKPALPVC